MPHLGKTGGALLALCGVGAVEGQTDRIGGLRLDQVQMIGTHNSYHQAPDRGLLDYLRTSGFRDGPDWSGARLARAIDYTRQPLSVQLDDGIRALELDVHDDPDGTAFRYPPFLKAPATRGAVPDHPWDPDGEMEKPGFKTLHKAAYDPRSACPLFVRCLAEIASWSDRHPDHTLIVVMIEVKPEASAKAAGCTALCDDGWERLKAVLLDGLGSRLIMPGDIGRQWPTLDGVRGRIMVMLLNNKDTMRSYRRQTDKAGEDILFTALRPLKKAPLRPDGHSRIAILPNPGDPRIGHAQRMGMLVYTRADADTEEARTGSTNRRNAAFASGATFVATDYPAPDQRFSSYSVNFAGGRFLRCNPVTAKGICDPSR